MKFQPFGKLNEIRLRKFEANQGIALPTDYCRFLLQTNGGTALQARVWLSELQREIVIDCFFGLGLASALDLQAWADQFEAELPSDAVIIGSDPFGALLVLGCGDEVSGIYLYDHAQQISGSRAAGNAYVLAESWSELDEAMATFGNAENRGGGPGRDKRENLAEERALAQKAAETSYWVPGGIDQARAEGKASLQSVDRLQQARFTHQAAFTPVDSPLRA